MSAARSSAARCDSGKVICQAMMPSANACNSTSATPSVSAVRPKSVRGFTAPCPVA
ncbi:MAG: hypothetical protein NUV55_09110 [Sulfuricaulis sp.]|uniref:hypothetical protein n=1 Tax=Sulfuricaulis sp. TaxID=2003553 RepID=UPI0025E9B436|nr:hypothetical protein [Sulfuricaulis sp.]MCR4347341.1 hypothetical protein [Sulfuricaulis sp.]